MSTMNDPYQLILAKKFNEAIIEYTKKIETEPSCFAYAGRAFAYINIGKLEKALDDYQKCEYYANQEIHVKTDFYMKGIGMILWLMGREPEAAELWNKAVQEHIAGKIEYSDMAGGVESGALLWFASSRYNLSHYREIANKYLTKKSKSSRIKHWPGPIAQYILGKISDECLLNEVCRVSGILKDRRFCQAYFYMGIKALQENRLDDYQKLLAKAIEMGENNLIEKEYYLAKHELELYSKRVS